MNNIKEFTDYLKIKNPRLFEDEHFCILSEEYNTIHDKIRVRTKYGEHLIFASNLRNNFPTIRSAIDREAYIHEMLLDLNSHYKKGEFKIIKHIDKERLLLKSEFGKHIMTINSPIDKNSSTTIKSAIAKELFILNRFKKLHGNLYHYEDFLYVNMNQKINIKCKKHGWFKQSIDKHLQKRGCPKCGRESTKNYLRKNNNGWGWKSWYRQGKKSKNFDSFKCYVIRCWNEEEEFYKIGKTYTTMEKRFSIRKLQMPYNYEIKYISASFDAEYISKLEKKLLIYNKDNKYKPKVYFNGLTECFLKVDGL